MTPQDFANLFKPSAPNYFGSTTFKPGGFSFEDLASRIGKYTGVEFKTGKRVDLALDLLQKQYGNQLTQQLPTPPSTAGAGTLSPTDLDIEQYVKLQKALQPGLFESELKQNVLGLGAATAFGAASLPFTEYMRNKELERQSQAFMLKEASPTATQARISQAKSDSANKMLAYAQAKRNLIEPLIRRV